MTGQIHPATLQAVTKLLIGEGIRKALVSGAEPPQVAAILAGELVNAFARMGMPSGSVAENLRLIAGNVENHPERFGFTEAIN